MNSTLPRLTVKLDSALDDVVAHDVAVGEVLGNDSSLSLINSRISVERFETTAHLGLVLLGNVVSGGTDGSRAGSTGGKNRSGLGLCLRRRGDLEVSAVKRAAVEHPEECQSCRTLAAGKPVRALTERCAWR